MFLALKRTTLPVVSLCALSTQSAVSVKRYHSLLLSSCGSENTHNALNLRSQPHTTTFIFFMWQYFFMYFTLPKYFAIKYTVHHHKSCCDWLSLFLYLSCTYRSWMSHVKLLLLMLFREPPSSAVWLLIAFCIYKATCSENKLSNLKDWSLLKEFKKFWWISWETFSKRKSCVSQYLSAVANYWKICSWCMCWT